MGPFAVPKWVSIAAVVLFAAAVGWHGLRPLADTDLWWHIRIGEEVLASGSLLPTDPFSYTHEGAPWQWKDLGFALLLYGGWWLGGVAGLVLLKAALVGALAGLVAASLRLRERFCFATILATTAIVFDATAFRLTLRAATLSLVLMAATLALIERDRRGRAGLGWCIAITLVNANMHRAALVLPVVLATYAVAVLVERFVFERERTWRRPVAVAVASAVACLATPFGTAIFSTTRSMVTEYSALITEWAPVEPDLVWALTPATALVMVGTAVGATISAVRDRCAWTIGSAGLAFALGLGSLRHLPYLALFGAPAMAVAIEAALRRASALVLVAISLAVPIAALSLQLARPLAAPRLGLAPGHFPERGLAFICDLPEPLALRGRVFNEFAYGGLVIFSLWPSQQVYIDGRTDLVYPPAAVRTYLAAMNDAAAFEREAAKYGIEWVFLDNAPQKKSRLHFDRNPQWALVHASQRALIYVRRGGINGALVEEHAYQLLEAHALLPSLQRALAGGRGAEALVELQRMRREDPDNVYAAMALIELERRVRSH